MRAPTSPDLRRVYLDFNATTPLSASFLEEIASYLSAWGNPSSIHQNSRAPKMILRETRRKLAEILECSPLELIFNSGASEGNNTVFHSVWARFGLAKNEYVISAVEHPSVQNAANYLESLGAVVHRIPVDRRGVMDLDFARAHINARTALVSCMWANNETGSVFPVETLSAWAQAQGSLMHVDAVQMLGKSALSLKDLPVNYLTLSAHKFYALKGCGVLFVRKGSPYTNLIFGGGQERGRRGGTENVLAVASLGQQLKQLNLLPEAQQRMQTACKSPVGVECG
jgi:cysteine desulfurase